MYPDLQQKEHTTNYRAKNDKNPLLGTKEVAGPSTAIQLGIYGVLAAAGGAWIIASPFIFNQPVVRACNGIIGGVLTVYSIYKAGKLGCAMVEQKRHEEKIVTEESRAKIEI